MNRNYLKIFGLLLFGLFTEFKSGQLDEFFAAIKGPVEVFPIVYLCNKKQFFLITGRGSTQGKCSPIVVAMKDDSKDWVSKRDALLNPIEMLSTCVENRINAFFISDRTDETIKQQIVIHIHLENESKLKKITDSVKGFYKIDNELILTPIEPFLWVALRLAIIDYNNLGETFREFTGAVGQRNLTILKALIWATPDKDRVETKFCFYATTKPPMIRHFDLPGDGIPAACQLGRYDCPFTTACFETPSPSAIPSRLSGAGAGAAGPAPERPSTRSSGYAYAGALQRPITRPPALEPLYANLTEHLKESKFGDELQIVPFVFFQKSGTGRECLIISKDYGDGDPAPITISNVEDVPESTLVVLLETLKSFSKKATVFLLRQQEPGGKKEVSIIVIHIEAEDEKTAEKILDSITRNCGLNRGKIITQKQNCNMFYADPLEKSTDPKFKDRSKKILDQVQGMPFSIKKLTFDLFGITEVPALGTISSIDRQEDGSYKFTGSEPSVVGQKAAALPKPKRPVSIYVREPKTSPVAAPAVIQDREMPAYLTRFQTLDWGDAFQVIPLVFFQESDGNRECLYVGKNYGDGAQAQIAIGNIQGNLKLLLTPLGAALQKSEKKASVFLLRHQVSLGKVESIMVIHMEAKNRADANAIAGLIGRGYDEADKMMVAEYDSRFIYANPLSRLVDPNSADASKRLLDQINGAPLIIEKTSLAPFGLLENPKLDPIFSIERQEDGSYNFTNHEPPVSAPGIRYTIDSSATVNYIYKDTASPSADRRIVLPVIKNLEDLSFRKFSELVEHFKNAEANPKFEEQLLKAILNELDDISKLKPDDAFNRDSVQSFVTEIVTKLVRSEKRYQFQVGEAKELNELIESFVTRNFDKLEPKLAARAKERADRVAKAQRQAEAAAKKAEAEDRKAKEAAEKEKKLQEQTAQFQTLISRIEKTTFDLEQRFLHLTGEISLDLGMFLKKEVASTRAQLDTEFNGLLQEVKNAFKHSCKPLRSTIATLYTNPRLPPQDITSSEECDICKEQKCDTTTPICCYKKEEPDSRKFICEECIYKGKIICPFCNNSEISDTKPGEYKKLKSEVDARMKRIYDELAILKANHRKKLAELEKQARSKGPKRK